MNAEPDGHHHHTWCNKEEPMWTKGSMKAEPNGHVMHDFVYKRDGLKCEHNEIQRWSQTGISHKMMYPHYMKDYKKTEPYGHSMHVEIH